MLTFLEGHGLKLLFFGGKGGVGKTTCATAAALQLARSSPRAAFLLISTDPAHSVGDSLAGLTPPANLTVLELDARGALAAFQAEHRQKLREIALRGTFLDEEDLGHFLDLSLPGLDELMALLMISRTAAARRYDTLVVDTAPTGHTLRLLTMPELLRRWLGVLDTLLAKHRFLRRRFNGACPADEVDAFLLDLAKSLKRLEALLKDPGRCRFVPVMLAEEMAVQETLDLLQALKRLQVPVSEIVINRLIPESPCPGCTGARRRQRRIIQGLADAEALAGCDLWGVPLHRREVRGKSLEKFWGSAAKLMPGEAPAPPRIFPLPPRVEDAPALPSSQSRFLIFAGKGGVGKTTLACATALRLAQDLKGQEILLISTDPAHSLADCLKMRLGPEPTRVLPALMAMEMDPARELDSLKREFRQGLERFLEPLGRGFDLPFDRRALEQLLELSPPGLDEIMALTRTLDFLEQGPFHLFVLDAAPTGHLLRLLEMPEIMDQWLKGFFGVLLKYRLAFRMPGFSQRLVRISKGLKRLRKLWCDPDRTAVYVVAGLTEMAFRETADLVAACQRLGLPTPVLFLNQATPAAPCPLCAAMNLREAQVKARFLRKFKDRHLTLVYRQDEPRGLKRLAGLGQNLYQPRGRRPVLYDRPGRKGAGSPCPSGRPYVRPIPG